MKIRLSLRARRDLPPLGRTTLFGSRDGAGSRGNVRGIARGMTMLCRSYDNPEINRDVDVGVSDRCLESRSMPTEPVSSAFEELGSDDGFLKFRE